MLYRVLKIWVRAASFIFCRRIVIRDPAWLKRDGPLLLAANHPNSFLDAVMMDILFRRPVYSLARGDAFRKPAARRWLQRLKMLPVYRTSEGVENLGVNYRTFETCRDLFRANGIVLIFSEGLGKNEWRLRPLKKGTARLAFSAWEEGIPLTVLPVAITYSSFRRFGKNVFIRFGEPMRREDFMTADSHGKRHALFNEVLREQLGSRVEEIGPGDLARQRQILRIPVTVTQKILLALPALAGWLLHLPLYLPVYGVVRRATRGTIHFDSVMVGALTLLYPFYLLLVLFLLFWLTGSWYSLGALAVLPMLARAWVRIGPQTD